MGAAAAESMRRFFSKTALAESDICESQTRLDGACDPRSRTLAARAHSCQPAKNARVPILNNRPNPLRVVAVSAYLLLVGAWLLLTRQIPSPGFIRILRAMARPVYQGELHDIQERRIGFCSIIQRAWRASCRIGKSAVRLVVFERWATAWPRACQPRRHPELGRRTILSLGRPGLLQRIGQLRSTNQRPEVHRRRGRAMSGPAKPIENRILPLLCDPETGAPLARDGDAYVKERRGIRSSMASRALSQAISTSTRSASSGTRTTRRRSMSSGTTSPSEKEFIAKTGFSPGVSCRTNWSSTLAWAPDDIRMSRAAGVPTLSGST